MFSFDAIVIPLVLLIVINAIGLFAYVMWSRVKVRREQRNVANVALAIIDYFKRSGVNVACSCVRMPGKASYTAFVESEPMKRFRLSHIIEMTLCEHVRKTCGLELGKVYWRFPIKEAKEVKEAAAAVQASAAINEEVGVGQEGLGHEKSDEYIHEGLEHYKYIPKVEATESSWEHFEQVSGNTDGGGQPIPPSHAENEGQSR
jgi:hypothetical protein